jgi:hypothetical protein
MTTNTSPVTATTSVPVPQQVHASPSSQVQAPISIAGGDLATQKFDATVPEKFDTTVVQQLQTQLMSNSQPPIPSAYATTVILDSTTPSEDSNTADKGEGTSHGL